MRRLFVASIVLVVAGLFLLLPSSALYNLLTTGSASGTVAQAFAVSTSSDNTTTIESLAGFAMIGVGALLEVFAVFTDFPVTITAPAVEEKQR